MTSIRQCTMNDLLYFNNVNLDILTETYNLSFYMSYMTYWPESFLIAKGPSSTTTMNTVPTVSSSSSQSHHSSQPSSYSTSDEKVKHHINSNYVKSAYNNYDIMGYVLGKSEGDGILWHGHVSAITVNKLYRRIGLAATLMSIFENDICNDIKHNHFVDLFVRTSNTLAIQMYTNFGYRIYRTVLGYYQTTTTTVPSNTNITTTATVDGNNTTVVGETTTTTTTNINGGEDAYDMRKSLSRDPKQLSMIPLLHPIYPEDLEW